MKFKIIAFLFIIIFIVLSHLPAFALNDNVHFDSDGNIIDKINYLIIVSEWEKALKLKLRNRYNSEFNVWKDPIKLRKKRIFQWRIMRSFYNPDSLPKNIENFSTKK